MPRFSSLTRVDFMFYEQSFLSCGRHLFSTICAHLMHGIIVNSASFYLRSSCVVKRLFVIDVGTQSSHYFPAFFMCLIEAYLFYRDINGFYICSLHATYHFNFAILKCFVLCIDDLLHQILFSGDHRPFANKCHCCYTREGITVL